MRARYYSPETGRFISADPFPGVLSLPATQNAYPYGINNPLSYTDPNGEILPFIAAGLAGGIIGGGMSVVEQCIGSSDLKGCLKCLDWKKVGTAAAAGAVAGFVGFGVGLALGTIGTGILPTIAGGFLAGMITGQVYRATELAVSGNWDQAGSVLLQLEDILIDGVLGGLGSAVGYGVGKIVQKILSRYQYKTRVILNKRGEEYPKYDIPGYGRINFPDPPYEPNNSQILRDQFNKTYKQYFQQWWVDQGYLWPEGEVHIHHIKPLKYGGTNDFDNLVPLNRSIHKLFTNWWKNY